MNSARPLARSSLFVLGLLYVASVAGPAAAQEVTGAVQGAVVSAGGSPEPLVALTLSGPNLQGVRGTSTDARGFYQFLALPPGVYELHVSRVGLQPMEVKQILVELGRTTVVPTLTVKAQPIPMEPIVLQAPRVTLDPTHTEAGGTLRIKEYASLPVDRDYKSVIALLPQANAGYRGDPVNVAGSTGLENQYYIDGVNVTDTKTAERATSLPYNFVRTVEVKTAGYEAQYGRALGAVVNALTYSGTNEFEASAFGFTQPSGLAMDARLAPGIAVQQPVSYDWGVRAGGPMLRDRLWYSAAVNPRTDQVEKEIVGLGSFDDRTQAVRFASKLTWQATQTTNLELSVFGDPTTRDRVDPLISGITSATNPDPLLWRVESGGTIASLRGTVAPSSSVLLQASASQQWDRYSEEGATERGRSEVVYFDWMDGSMGGGNQARMEEHRQRTSLTARGTLLAPSHTVAAGVDYEDAKLSSAVSGDEVHRFDVSLFQRQQGVWAGTFHNRSPAAYVQDSWRISDLLTLNLGLRWSAQYLVGASGRIAQRITDEWQPRMGFSWQLGPTETQRIFGSYGRFYQTIPNNIASVFFEDTQYFISYYSTDPRQPGAVPDTVIDMSSHEEDYAHQIPGLRAENFDEFTLGYERLIREETRLTVRAMRRDLRSSFQWGFDPSRGVVIGTPGEGNFDFLPRPKREYTSLEIALDGTWNRWQYRTSYVLSRSWGNYPGLFDSDHGWANPGRVDAFMMPNQATNSTGLLPNDHTHVAKLSGCYTSQVGLVGGATLTYESGTPINDFAAGPWAAWFPSFLVPRGSAGRTPSLWDLSIRLAYNLPVARTPRAQVILDLLHVGNPRRTVKVDELHYTTLDENGNPATLNPMYKQATAYQPPMAVRLGMEVRY